MPQIDRKVTGLNQDVTHALQAIGNRPATVAEAKAVRQAILLDGEIDDAEADLIAEMSQKDRSQIEVGSAAGSISVVPFVDDALGQLSISRLALYRRKAEIVVDNGIAKGKQLIEQGKHLVHEAEAEIKEVASEAGSAFQHLYQEGKEFMTELFTYQYATTGHDALGSTPAERQANCGPSSASMVLKHCGIEPPTLTELRKLVNAPVGSSKGTYALTTHQVGEAVKRAAAQYGKTINYNVMPLATNVDQALATIRKQLDAGKQVILLSSNIAVQKGTAGKGHYVMVESVQPDGSLIINDPQKAVEAGLGRTHTKAQFANALSRRVNLFHAQNELIVFDQVGDGRLVS